MTEKEYQIPLKLIELDDGILTSQAF